MAGFPRSHHIFKKFTETFTARSAAFNIIIIILKRREKMLFICLYSHTAQIWYNSGVLKETLPIVKFLPIMIFIYLFIFLVKAFIWPFLKQTLNFVRSFSFTASRTFPTVCVWNKCIYPCFSWNNRKYQEKKPPYCLMFCW